MVSKLLLAVQENFWQAHDGGADPAITAELAAAYYDIRAGIGFNKPPEVYGAFPTDPYSHTPKGQGAKQPGMTGQVKEEILTRFGELGVRVEEGAIVFEPVLLRAAGVVLERRARSSTWMLPAPRRAWRSQPVRWPSPSARRRSCSCKARSRPSRSSMPTAGARAWRGIVCRRPCRGGSLRAMVRCGR